MKYIMEIPSKADFVTAYYMEDGLLVMYKSDKIDDLEPKINGCTNGQTMEYASDIPNDCPISVQPRKGKWLDYSDEGYVECPFCHSATNCDGNKDELHYCFSCGAELR